MSFVVVNADNSHIYDFFDGVETRATNSQIDNFLDTYDDYNFLLVKRVHSGRTFGYVFCSLGELSLDIDDNDNKALINTTEAPKIMLRTCGDVATFDSLTSFMSFSEGTDVESFFLTNGMANAMIPLTETMAMSVISPILGMLPYLIGLLIVLVAFWKSWYFLCRCLRSA